jgi:hypothetical protein
MGTRMIERIFKALLWSLPYLVGGFSAPFIFKAAPNPVTGGHYAGTLFIVAGLWAVALSFQHGFPLWARSVFLAFIFIEAVFWSWRFRITTPLRESYFLGINGGAWHAILTLIYVTLAILLVVLEYKRTTA